MTRVFYVSLPIRDTFPSIGANNRYELLDEFEYLVLPGLSESNIPCPSSYEVSWITTQISPASREHQGAQ